ncbi:MAG: hypothetical protein MJB57_07990 [Gemmatimonadetes bacterium]|nr:hypothetical protein [Gemmatimonadota bacterium]
MSKGSFTPDSLDRARDELFSHIRRCGVLDAESDQREEWFDDTIQYLGERYPELGPQDLSDLRTIGERYCAPAIPHGGAAAAETPTEGDEAEAASDEAEVVETEVAVDTGEVSAA